MRDDRSPRSRKSSDSIADPGCRGSMQCRLLELEHSFDVASGRICRPSLRPHAIEFAIELPSRGPRIATPVGMGILRACVMMGLFLATPGALQGPSVRIA